jgi:hypothetical protein
MSHRTKRRPVVPSVITCPADNPTSACREDCRLRFSPSPPCPKSVLSIFAIPLTNNCFGKFTLLGKEFPGNWRLGCCWDSLLFLLLDGGAGACPVFIANPAKTPVCGVPACGLTLTVDPSLTSVLLILAPIKTAIYGAIGATVVLMLAATRRRTPDKPVFSIISPFTADSECTCQRWPPPERS